MRHSITSFSIQNIRRAQNTNTPIFPFKLQACVYGFNRQSGQIKIPQTEYQEITYSS